MPILGPTNPTDCRFRGNSDMYGLGIRIGFYLQWYSSIIASIPIYTPRSGLSVLAPGDSKYCIFSNIIFTVATSLALLIEAQTLGLAEIYIISLLIFGYIYYIVLSQITRILRRCNPHWSPSGSKQPGPIYVRLTSAFLSAISGIELWFWGGRVRHSSATSGDCKAFGFGFKKVNLEDDGFIAFNITYSVFLLIWSVFSFWASFDLRFSASKQSEASLPNSSQRYAELLYTFSNNKITRCRGSRRETTNDGGYFGFEVLRSTLKLTFMTNLVVAIELSITWNQITEVHSLSSAGQIIPFFLGLAALMRVFYVAYTKIPSISHH